jgi:hypothetical protein
VAGRGAGAAESEDICRCRLSWSNTRHIEHTHPARSGKLGVGATQALFWAFAVVMGLSMASIFMVYTSTSIARVFFITAATFAGLSLYGYTTKGSSVWPTPQGRLSLAVSRTGEDQRDQPSTPLEAARGAMCGIGQPSRYMLQMIAVRANWPPS